MSTSMTFGSALLIILAIDVMLMLSQVAITSIDPEGTYYYNETGALIGSENQGGYTLAEKTDFTSLLPEAQDSVVADADSNIFVDAFKSLKNWFLDTTGLNYLIMFVNAVPNFLKAIGFPPILVFALGALWHLITVFLAVAFIMGR